MASQNNIFLVNAATPVRKYVKTVPSRVGGVRFDADGKNQTGFILDSDPNGFVYDSEVLEIYTEREDRAVRQWNQKLFTNGLLKEYNAEQPQIDLSNMLSDEDVTAIAAMRNLPALQKRLQEITSSITAQRIYDSAVELGRPAKTIASIKERVDALKS